MQPNRHIVYTQPMLYVKEKQLLTLLMDRIERISADSIWAHRASGVRATLMRMLDQIETKQIINENDLKRLIKQGFFILGHAAREKSGKRFYE